MKRILSLLLFYIPLCLNAQPGRETLTNAEIIKLSKLDFPPSAIITLIKNSKTHFDVSVDALANLKNDGVSIDVISEIISASVSETQDALKTQEVSPQKDYRDPKTMRKEGIYYFNKSDTNNLFITIDPTLMSNSELDGKVSSKSKQYTYRNDLNDQICEIPGAHSRKQIPHTKPKFYFYCTGSTSPGNFVLVKLTERKRSRQIAFGSYNANGDMTRIDNEQRVDFGYEQVGEGIYKVYSKAPFEDGEYCFLYRGSTSTIFSNSRIYDFGISIGSVN